MSEGRKNTYGYYGVYGSLAYDFRPVGNESAGEYSGKTEAKQKIKTKGRAGVSPALFVSALLCLVLLTAALICSSELVVLSDRVYSLNREIDELLEEQTRLEIEHGIVYSPQELERYAIEVLGMRKPAADQIIYIEVPETAQPEQVIAEETDEKDILSFLREYFPG